MTANPKKKAPELKFEEALERLGEIVSALEDESLGLDRSVELFSEGRRLAALCHEQLAAAEEQIRTLLKDDAGFREEPGLPAAAGDSDA